MEIVNSLISVIVPVYKVEEYLDECVQSLVDQSYTNLEIILVDDGSPDKCPQMCDAWAEKDSRIRVEHKKNGGLSSARNAGLDVAKGEYVSFVDSDDFFDKDMYKKLYEGITSSPNIGISAIKFLKYEEGVSSIFNPKWDTSGDVLVKAEDFGIKTLTQEVCHAATNKLYKKNLLENVRFREGKINEDVLFMHDISSIVLKNKCDMLDLSYYAYYYRMRPGSIGHSATPLYISVIDNMNTIMNEAADSEYKVVATKMYRRSIYEFCATLLSDRSENGKKLRSQYLKKYRDMLFSFNFSDITMGNDNSIRYKLSFFMIKYMPFVYSLYVVFRNSLASAKQ